MTEKETLEGKPAEDVLDDFLASSMGEIKGKGVNMCIDLRKAHDTAKKGEKAGDQAQP